MQGPPRKALFRPRERGMLLETASAPSRGHEAPARDGLMLNARDRQNDDTFGTVDGTSQSPRQTNPALNRATLHQPM
ncbi:hypothetical protein CR51_09620 [Caballeronia megalochromosomata]|nr:hypothetical protein CR51_09620 [Caballeronia megalochromosomata]